jgi:thiosulfate/3-mercaptopyruvate sulfurtransferase
MLVGASPVHPCFAVTTRPIDLARIDAATLHRDLGAFVILDGRPGKAFRQGHLPGARSFWWEDHTRTDDAGVPYRPMPAAQLAAALGMLGISETTPVVLYGDADESWGGEGWACWILAWLGHEGPLRVLDGGIQAWRAHGLPQESGPAGPADRPVLYNFGSRPHVEISATELRTAPDGYAIVDTRSKIEWLLGKIPGAVHIPWNEFHQGEERRPIHADDLSALLRAKGIGAERPVVYYCAGGVRSAYAWMVHELSGLPPARNYEGGMEDWKRKK